jgi:hypothetical protein
MKKKNGKWGLEGFDTFSNETYPLSGEYDTEEFARDAAKKRLSELEKTQPSASSGGQKESGIQDQVFVIRPDGTKYRYFE